MKQSFGSDMTDKPVKTEPLDVLENYEDFDDKSILKAISIMNNISRKYYGTPKRPRFDVSSKRMANLLKRGDSFFLDNASDKVRAYAIFHLWAIGMIPYDSRCKNAEQRNKSYDDVWRLALLASDRGLITSGDGVIYADIVKYGPDPSTVCKRRGNEVVDLIKADEGIKDIDTDNETRRRFILMNTHLIPDNKDFLAQQDDDLLTIIGCTKYPEGMLNNNAIPMKHVTPKLIKIITRNPITSYGGRRINTALKKWVLTLPDDVINSLIEDSNSIDDLYSINNLLRKSLGDKHLLAIASKINSLLA